MPDIVDRIEITLKEKGLTFNRVEADCQLGNGTIKRWRVQSPRLEKLASVSSYLGVSLDYLAFGSIQTESTPKGETCPTTQSRFEIYCDGQPLTENEADLVAMYRLLPTEHREEAFDIIHGKYTRTVVGTEKTGSIFSTYTDVSKQQKSVPVSGGETASGTA